MIDHDGRPLHLTWDYTRAEMIADAVVHGIGIAFGVIGGVAIIILAAVFAGWAQLAAVTVYAVGLVALLSVSAAYNLWPVSRTKWLLRRFDHALIYVLIAATYTPFITRFPHGFDRYALLFGVWAVAIAGAVLKIALPGRFDRLSIVLCILLGLSGGLAWNTVSSALPPSTVWLMVAGGTVYIAGVIFHVWDGLRFQNAVWHAFVLVASILFYSAVLDGVVFAQA
ncbi:PAQR family membrane homeostasis protein TrhA [Enterovirga aerilata]|uniref:Hemolysin III family protein n=1 Tax=Enterovirga aerilata TaxID=2730920 RepID=A0A849IEV3_9HYPH|nr:hemolysin III family protein [Enterovirga sp. DB1703]NNM72403.1 hemolysin III family protein [Enterovirga sp. DB1703]